MERKTLKGTHEQPNATGNCWRSAGSQPFIWVHLKHRFFGIFGHRFPSFLVFQFSWKVQFCNFSILQYGYNYNFDIVHEPVKHQVLRSVHRQPSSPTGSVALYPNLISDHRCKYESTFMYKTKIEIIVLRNYNYIDGWATTQATFHISQLCF